MTALTQSFYGEDHLRAFERRDMEQRDTEQRDLASNDFQECSERALRDDTDSAQESNTLPLSDAGEALSQHLGHSQWTFHEYYREAAESPLPSGLPNISICRDDQENIPRSRLPCQHLIGPPGGIRYRLTLEFVPITLPRSSFVREGAISSSPLSPSFSWLDTSCDM
jgi:hypothetical protein